MEFNQDKKVGKRNTVYCSIIAVPAAVIQAKIEA
jgi:hypothetical protein